MNKKLLWIAASIISFISFNGVARAQTNINVFDLPDSVCVKSPVIPFNIINGAASYSWDICAPDLFAKPQGRNVGSIDSIHGALGIVLMRENNESYTYHLNDDGNIIRSYYGNGYNENPTAIKTIGRVVSPRGLYAFKDEQSVYHLFALSGNTRDDSKITRFDFNNGIHVMPSDTVDLGLLPDLNRPNQYFMAKEMGNWYGFTFDRNDRLIKLMFGNDPLSVPTTQIVGNINGMFSQVSGLSGVQELGNWHLFATNLFTNNMVRISFGSSIENTPHVINLGNLSGTVTRPVGISIVKGCDAYYGYTVSFGTNSLVALKWENRSIAEQPEALSFGKTAGVNNSYLLTQIANEKGSLFMYCLNSDDEVSKIEFKPCDNSTINHSDQKHPPSFSFNEPGVYTVFLTLNEGTPEMEIACREIRIYPHPEMEVSRDTMICEGDEIRLQALSLGADSIIWIPNYNIDTTRGFYANISPKYDTTYYVTSYFSKRCVVQDTLNIRVSNLKSDAGKDRIIRDGATTILGGAETSLGSQYTYLWKPEIGITQSTATPITEARPPYDITYYLYVSNSDGCTVIDTVNVKVPCDDVYLPNLFTPGGSSSKTNTFGLLNIQFAKINYFKIFDRWGQEVFSTTNPNGRWDGKIDGKPAPMGVYVWEVDANCANTLERYRKSGSVTLLR